LKPISKGQKLPLKHPVPTFHEISSWFLLNNQLEFKEFETKDPLADFRMKDQLFQ